MNPWLEFILTVIAVIILSGPFYLFIRWFENGSKKKDLKRTTPLMEHESKKEDLPKNTGAKEVDAPAAIEDHEVVTSPAPTATATVIRKPSVKTKTSRAQRKSKGRK